MLAGIFLGCLDTASNSLVVWMLGPERSPPFTQSLHAMVALGFVLGSLIVRPFLPDREEDRMICERLSQDNLSLISDSQAAGPTAGQHDNLHLTAHSVLPLGWPFFIICMIHSFTALGYLALGIEQQNLNVKITLFVSVGLPIPMPKFYDSIRKGFVFEKIRRFCCLNQTNVYFSNKGKFRHKTFVKPERVSRVRRPQGQTSENHSRPGFLVFLILLWY